MSVVGLPSKNKLFFQTDNIFSFVTLRILFRGNFLRPAPVWARQVAADSKPAGKEKVRKSRSLALSIGTGFPVRLRKLRPS